MEWLPEECIAEILSRTSTRDVCRASAISVTLNSVADSDAVWGKLLPSDHAEIISRAQPPLSFTATKKELYFRLITNPPLLDDGKISFSIDRLSGKKCYMLGARELTIVWGSTPRYWEWRSIGYSRFPVVAILLLVWWFEIKCKIETQTLSPKTVYVAFLVFRFERRNYGFESLPITVSFKCIDEMGDENGSEMMSNTVCLKRDPSEPIPENVKIPKEIHGGWWEVELGEFMVNSDDNRQVEIRLFEVERGTTKGGLVVECIKFVPKVIA